ncbi:hypothetical protein [Microbacterium rhizomatis]|uniref:hypothetical protein n=1 Tax=Microbacterium rhizomatis TaxID=1631477 RepID=UPI001FE7630A|nr:hypothetical protein [Microbacterium rhizomatis]
MSSASSRSSSDPLANARHAAAARILEAVIAVEAANPVVLIDGRSGSGKSTLARELVQRWPLRGRVQLVGLDAIYPGWDGLDEGVRTATDTILNAHARGFIGVWERWDWAASQHAEAHAVDPALPLIVEGSGILTPVTARLADVRVWLESPTASRKSRALARDGETFRPHWTRWAEQEERHLTRDDPRAHATLTFEIP